MAENNGMSLTLPSTLQQKFVKLREAVPAITQQAHSEGVKYKFAKIFDVYKLLTPAMNAWGVNFDIVKEEATRHAENGDPIFYHSYVQRTRSGDRCVWVYEADITIRWTNADNPKDTMEVTLHAIGTNDSGPDKAKGSAWTYCIKYYLFEKFGIDQGEDDPDNTDRTNEAPQAAGQGTAPRNNQSKGNQQPPAQNGQSGQTGGPRQLSKAQMDRMYRKADNARLTNGQVDEWIREKFGHNDPRNMTREQYDTTCNMLDNTAKQGGNTNA